jgi:uncharacterized membrane protein YczE
MAVPSIIISLFIDFWDLVLLSNFEPTTMFLRILTSFIGGILIPLGLSFIIASHFPAGVFDELTLFIMEITNVKSIAKVRIFIEAFGVSLGVVFGLLAYGNLGSVGIASLIVVLILPPLLKFFLKKLGAINE